MTTHKKKILITGAAGYIASQILPTFREKYDLVLRDISTKDRQGNIVEGVEIAKIYGNDESSAFINGVLDSLYNDLKNNKIKL